MGKIQIKTQNEFTLNKVKFPGSGGLEVDFQLETVGQDGKSVANLNYTCDDQPHPTLLEILEEMKYAVAFSANLIAPIDVMLKEGNAILDPKIKKKTLNDQRESLKAQLFKDVRVTGISFNHNNEGYKVKITGGFDSPLGYSAINTPAIGFQEDKHGFEVALEDALERLQVEVFEYIANNKRAQLDMFDADDAEVTETIEETVDA